MKRRPKISKLANGNSKLRKSALFAIVKEMLLIDLEIITKDFLSTLKKSTICGTIFFI